MQRFAEPAARSGLHVSGIACERGGKTLFGPLDLTVDRGAALFVLGPNGSGKSTLLRTLAGLLEPLAGRAHWSGEPVRFNAATWRSRVAYLGHRLGHKDELTVAENLELATRLEGVRPTPDVRHSVLARVGLEKLQALAARRLSQGQKQRLALARLCLSERPVWLLDEPSAALDAHAKGILAAILDDHLHAEGIAVVATHETFELGAGRATTLRLA